MIANVLLSYVMDGSLLYIYDSQSQADIPSFANSASPRLDIGVGFYMWDVTWWSLSLGYPVAGFNIFGGTQGLATEVPHFDEYGFEVERFFTGEFLLLAGASKKFGPLLAGASLKFSYESLGEVGKIGGALSASAVFTPYTTDARVGILLEGIGFSTMSPASLSLFGRYTVSKKHKLELRGGTGFTLIKSENYRFLFDSASLSLIWDNKLGLGGTFGGLNTGIGFLIKPLNFYSNLPGKFPLPEMVLSLRYSFTTGRFSIEVRLSQIGGF